MPFERTSVQENTDILGKGANEALNALDIREAMVIAETEELVSGGIETTEFTHRNVVECCDFVSGQFPKLPNLNFLG